MKINATDIADFLTFERGLFPGDDLPLVMIGGQASEFGKRHLILKPFETCTLPCLYCHGMPYFCDHCNDTGLIKMHRHFRFCSGRTTTSLRQLIERRERAESITCKHCLISLRHAVKLLRAEYNIVDDMPNDLAGDLIADETNYADPRWQLARLWSYLERKKVLS